MQKRLLEWYVACGRHDLPWRHTSDPYQILVSELMLQQTQVERVIPYFQRWIKRFPNLNALASADLDDVLRHWQGLGYYRRARSLKALADALVANHESSLPRSVTELRAMPGIGPYTANALLAFAWDQPASPVDTNLARVLTRIFGVSRTACDALAQRLTTGASARTLASALMDFGALQCVARNPECTTCPMARTCHARQSDADLSPPAKVGPKAEAATLAIGALHDNSRLLLPRRRPQLLHASLAETRDPRRALQAIALAKFGVEIAVRPACGRAQLAGQVVSLHRCTLLLGARDRFQPASGRQVQRLSADEQSLVAQMKLKIADS